MGGFASFGGTRRSQILEAKTKLEAAVDLELEHGHRLFASDRCATCGTVLTPAPHHCPYCRLRRLTEDTAQTKRRAEFFSHTFLAPEFS